MLTDAHHGPSHHGYRPAQMEKWARVSIYHMEQFAYFLDRLQSMPDGEGTLLDHVTTNVRPWSCHGHSAVGMGLLRFSSSWSARGVTPGESER